MFKHSAQQVPQQLFKTKAMFLLDILPSTLSLK